MKKLSDYIYPHYREHGATSIKKVSEVIIFLEKPMGYFPKHLIALYANLLCNYTWRYTRNVAVMIVEELEGNTEQ